MDHQSSRIQNIHEGYLERMKEHQAQTVHSYKYNTIVYLHTL